MNVSDQLLDLSVIRQLLLERVVAGQSIQLNKQLDAIAAELQKQLKGKELTEYQGRRLDKAIAQLKGIIKVKAPDLSELSAAEAEFFRDAMVGVGIDATLPPVSVINSIADSALIQGATIGDWFSRLNESTRFDVERTVKNGVALGQTNSQIAKALIGTGDKGGEPIAKSRRDAMAITRTAVQTVSKDARLASLEVNANLFKEVQWVSTLDSRTSDICIVRSGKLWTYPDFKPVKHKIPWNGGPPAHWNCRSTFIPITKSFEELTNGRVKDKVEPATRASMDGYVAADLTFDAFLRSKPPEFADQMLGKGRAELWRSGKITLNQLLDQRGNPLTLAELRSKYGGIAENATQAIKPAPKVDIYAPAINPAVNERSVVVIPRKDAQKAMTAQFERAAKNSVYAIENGPVFKNVKIADFGKSNLSSNFTDEAMSMILAIKPELDNLAFRFKIPEIRGFKTSSGTIGSMGDGIMTLNPSYFSGYATNVGGRVSVSGVEALKASTMEMQQQLSEYRSQLRQLDKQIAAVPRNSEEYKKFWAEKSEIIILHNRLAPKYNKNIKALELTKITQRNASEWKVGDDLSKKPHGVEDYMDNGMDKARTVLYHEFAHHLHQIYGKTQSLRAGPPPIEQRLRALYKLKTNAQKLEQPSKYANTNEKEWFAENFALYMMGRRKMVDADVAKLIEELLSEQAN